MKKPYRLLFFVFLTAVPLVAQISSPKTVSVPGKVVGPDGKAVADAEILLEDGETMRTDATGHFVAQVKPWDSTDFVGRITARSPHGLGATLVRRDDKSATIHLQKFVMVSGRVQDEKGADVPNVTVRIGMANGNARAVVLLSGSQWQHDYAVKTDAQGRWTMKNVPAPGGVSFEMVDPRFATARDWKTIRESTDDGPTLIARPGASFGGRAVYEDGRPAPDFSVSAQGQQSGNGGGAKSGADGTFTIPSLAAGSYNVCLTDAKREWVANAVEGVVAQPGETKILRDFVLTRGVILKGRVVDAATGKGIAKADIGSYGAQNPKSSAMCIPALADAQGRFQLRVAPGETYVYVMGPASGYIYEHPSQTLDVKPGEKREIVLKLHRGATLRGVTVDEKGKPLLTISLLLTPLHCKTPSCVPVAQTTKTNAKGEFTSPVQEADTVKIAAAGPWQVVKPAQANLKLGDNGPLRVVLRSRPQKTRIFRASAVDSTGAPLSGVEMRLEIGTPWANDDGGYSVETHFLTSDARGRFIFDKLLPKQIVNFTLTKTGYRMMSGAQQTSKPEEITASPAVFAKLDGVLRGQICDENSAPAANAWVSVPESGFAPRQTDAEGRFAFEKLPRGPVSLLAARGNSTLREATQTGAEIQAKLHPAPPQAGRDIERAAQILESIEQDSDAQKNYYAHGSLAYELAPIDLERALKLAKDKDGKLDDKRAAALYSVALEANSARAAELAPLVLASKPSSEKYQILLPLLPKLSQTQPAMPAQLFEEAKAWFAGEAKTTAQKKGIEYESSQWQLAIAAFDVAALADLSHAESDSWLQRVVSEAGKVPKDERPGSGPNMVLSEIAAAGLQFAPSLGEKLLDKLPVAGQANALGSSISDIAPRDLPFAQRLLEHLHKLPALSVSDVGGTYNSVPEWAFGLAAKGVISHLGQNDPAAALQLAREVTHKDHKAEALALAAQFQPKEQAIALLHEAAALATGQNESVALLARFGAMAYDFEPSVARELWERALALRVQNLYTRGSTIDIAFYLARDDAARARLMIENAFAVTRATAGGQNWSLSGCAMAMCAVDVDRALQMADEIPLDESGARFEAQRKIAQYLLATPEVRRTLRIDRWGASDTWRPGTPTHW